MKKSYSYLYRPRNYDEIKAGEVNNGCGPAGWKGNLIPDTIWGISISAACKIHDYEYYTGKTIGDKENADIRFYDNMILIIVNESRWWNRWLNANRRIRAWAYFKAVREFGGDHFFKAK